VLGLPPVQGSPERLLMQREPEAAGVVGLPHPLKPASHAFGVAVLAPRADLGAAGERVPGGSCPLDGRANAHALGPFAVANSLAKSLDVGKTILGLDGPAQQ
jgi:hypothetical protein